LENWWFLNKSSQAIAFEPNMLPFFKNEAELIGDQTKNATTKHLNSVGYFSAETWDINDETKYQVLQFV
jgi:hypothetical protein